MDKPASSGTALAAAASFLSDTVEVYFQDPAGSSGGVRAAKLNINSDAWSGGGPFDVRFEAKHESPLAAMQSTDVRPHLLARSR